ncbi:MAG: phosphatidylserine decarboxylase, partial [Bifidobacteriaceae bacterium]|nr:phosphatidylserine decarboxylase [Bifidobacteriaceae bacterium]
MSQRPGEGAGQRPGVGALLRRLGESAGYLSGARHPVRRLTEDGGQPSATEPQERRPGRDSSAGSAAGVPKARIYDREAGRYITEVAPSAGVLRFLYSGTRAGEAGRSFANRPGLSRAAMAAARLPGSARAIDGFAARHGIDLRECEETSWPNFAAFFTRRLKPSARPIDQAEDALVAPADSRLLAVPITPGLRLDIKGTQYTLPDLTGPSVPASDFEGGWCLVFRLAIEDCHRFISVDNATVTSRWRARGRLDTVGPASRDLPVLATNSRIVTMLDGANLGAFCLVAVGAMMVGSIHLSSSARHRRGQEAGYFDLGGSTLVLLLRPGLCQPDPDILDASRRGIETRVKLGGRIATVHPCKSPPHPAADAVPNLVWSSGTTPASSGGVLSAGVVGAKAAVLGALAGGGLPVPGFVAVTTSAMARALDSCRTELEAALAAEDVQVAAAGAAEALQGLRAGADLEEALASHLSADITYAVRSSALDEDGTETSAAGRYLTHLDVPAD